VPPFLAVSVRALPAARAFVLQRRENGGDNVVGWFFLRFSFSHAATKHCMTRQNCVVRWVLRACGSRLSLHHPRRGDVLDVRTVVMNGRHGCLRTRCLARTKSGVRPYYLLPFPLTVPITFCFGASGPVRILLRDVCIY
jgi:hypothetical protein